MVDELVRGRSESFCLWETDNRTSEGASEDESEGASEDEAEGASEDESGGASEDESGGASEDESGGAFEDESEGASEDEAVLLSFLGVGCPSQSSGSRPIGHPME